MSLAWDLGFVRAKERAAVRGELRRADPVGATQKIRPSRRDAAGQRRPRMEERRADIARELLEAARRAECAARSLSRRHRRYF